ncbi:GNAT family N-acetyltransferase [Histidinibacterium lentulum]|uniref:GNAT family N-acetyltransferase n=1 Tax=Histidinibacterium lentulum TaxID=2480588 RepID=A0A3N2QR95_9RHOB|nr:GNAT family N-acetyltransferase [Histidinibacterium lentulum]ROT97738.1 GNAT family N-acetyltransferase [Histidinibacterium lentulum]
MTPAALSEILDATWPASAVGRSGGFTLRGDGSGGRRVSAATADGAVTEAGLDEAETAMRAEGRAPLFMVREGEIALDVRLAARGYEIAHPTRLIRLDIPLAPPPPGIVHAHWPPLAIQRDLWAAGGVGPDRLAIMARARPPRTSLLARAGQRPAGTAFAALSGRAAMLHALEVAPSVRRRGIGTALVAAAARWAARHGAATLLLLVEAGNTASLALCRRLGASETPAYHYRIAARPG